jgi:CRP-like cAMP-binding protein
VLPNVATASTAFGELSPDQQAEIWSRARVRHLLSGETLILQNTSADAVFVVVSGPIRGPRRRTAGSFG